LVAFANPTLPQTNHGSVRSCTLRATLPIHLSQFNPQLPPAVQAAMEAL